MGRGGETVTATLAFRYRATRADGVVELGSLRAESRNAVRDAIVRRGLFVLAIEEEPAGESGRGSMSADDAALGLKFLAQLLGAGLSLHRALAAFEEIAPRSWAPHIPQLQQAVRDGRGLGAALDATPIRLAPVVGAIVAAGEAGGGLAPSLAKAASVAEAARATRTAVHAALAYPVILGVAGSASIALMANVVLPRFAAILGDLGQPLPATTRVVLSAAHLVGLSTIPTVVGTIVGALAWRAWLRRPGHREHWYAMLLRWPFVGSVRLSMATSRTADALAALLTAGVGLIAALPHAARASGDPFCTAALLRVRERLLRGERLAAALLSEGAMTATAIRLVRAGEETGRLSVMLDEAAKFERERAEQLVRGAVRIIEPAFILLFGGLVALIAAALLQALYGIRPT